ncbi:hypothetical protein [Anaerosporobacter sp.]|uniref:hypothetical protein n=1 Tax=Anaerosporobacter sp. TaxID=1872529 RepID=UPI003FA4B09C
MTDWNGTTTYEYDANGQVSKVTDSNNQTIEYTWTKLGQKKTITYPTVSATGGTTGASTADTVSYTYDNNGNLLKVMDTNGGVTTYKLKGYKGEIMNSANPYRVVAEKYAWMSAAWFWTDLKPCKKRLDEYMDSGYKLDDCFIVISSFVQGSRGANEDYKKIAAGKYKKIDYSSVYNGTYGKQKTYVVVDIEVINGGIVVSSNNWNDRTEKFNSAYDIFGGY